MCDLDLADGGVARIQNNAAFIRQLRTGEAQAVVALGKLKAEDVHRFQQLGRNSKRQSLAWLFLQGPDFFTVKQDGRLMLRRPRRRPAVVRGNNKAQSGVAREGDGVALIRNNDLPRGRLPGRGAANVDIPQPIAERGRIDHGRMQTPIKRASCFRHRLPVTAVHGVFQKLGRPGLHDVRLQFHDAAQGSARAERHNGDTLPGFSSTQAIAAMERVADETLPPGFGYEWTDIAYQQKAAGNTAIYIFPLCVLFVFLALSAQYESWLLPLAVILIVPMCLLCAIVGIWLRGLENNILVQIGFVVLIGLACKNAILIVEFAKAEEDAGRNRFDAAVQACRLRLRPILMTSMTIILALLPAALGLGAGSDTNGPLAVAVIGGLVSSTLLTLVVVPSVYSLVEHRVEKFHH